MVVVAYRDYHCRRKASLRGCMEVSQIGKCQQTLPNYETIGNWCSQQFELSQAPLIHRARRALVEGNPDRTVSLCVAVCQITRCQEFWFKASCAPRKFRCITAIVLVVIAIVVFLPSASAKSPMLLRIVLDLCKSRKSMQNFIERHSLEKEKDTRARTKVSQPEF